MPNIDQQQLTVRVILNDEASVSQIQVQAVAFADSIPVDKKYGYGNAELILNISNPHLWSPEDPYLYNLRVTSNTFSGINDTVYSYFGMRKSA